jgi:esterase FrsA
MFTFPLEPGELLDQRAPTGGLGHPGFHGRQGARAASRDVGDGPSSWVPAWSRKDERVERDGRWLEAACTGAPRGFHVLRPRAGEQPTSGSSPPTSVPRLALPPTSSGSRSRCRSRKGRPRFPCTSSAGGERHRGRCSWISGGVDTWKVELHKLLVAIARFSGLTVATIDMPSTGESQVPLDPGGDQIHGDVVDQLAGQQGAHRTSFFGISFGGHWAAKLALTDRGEAAIDLGDPVGAGEQVLDFAVLPNGMIGIIANALGLGELPTRDEAAEFVERFSLKRQGRLDARFRAALLAVSCSKIAPVVSAKLARQKRRPEDEADLVQLTQAHWSHWRTASAVTKVQALNNHPGMGSPLSFPVRVRLFRIRRGCHGRFYYTRAQITSNSRPGILRVTPTCTAIPVPL